MKRGILHTIVLFFAVSFFSGCSTEKNTRVSRAYHNLTSRYNVNFNAKQSLKSGEDKIEQTVKDDYTHLLPIFKDEDPSTANAVKSDMENVVLKSSKLIKIHSITKKPRRHRSGGSRRYQQFARKEEFNNWIDDSYFLMGKAYFYQDNFISGIENFNYIIRKFPDGNLKYDSFIWLVRCYTELERFSDASNIIVSLEGDNKFPRRLENDLAVVTADYYIKLKEFDDAIKYLDIAIQKTFWKKQKARLAYILAQLYEQTGKPTQASQMYTQVVRYNPPYAMAFNSRIKAASIFTGEGDVAKLKKELNKMLNDEKNIEFRDQIYYAIGNLLLKEGDKEGAVKNYRNSVTNSVTNSYQLAQSAITLADIYFTDKNYGDAQAYYDSAMIVIDDKYPNYPTIATRYKSLTQLVKNINMVSREDSLQIVAKMSEEERNQLIDKLIRDVQEKKAKAEKAAQGAGGDASFYRANQYRLGLGSNQNGSGWYFYNPQSVSFGKVQFAQRWGKRTLEDDWRRSDKTTISMEEAGELSEATDSLKAEIKRVEDPTQREYYIQDIPLTDSMLALSHERIKDALYNAGKLFKSEFSNYERSSEEFEDLNKRYPKNIYTLSNYFDLYDNNELLGNKERSAFYKNLIIQEFPESKYAKYLVNPNFFVDLEAQKDSLNRLYELTFEKYRIGQYPQVIALTGQLKDLKPDSTIIPKIDFLRTVGLGTQSDLPKFESLLKEYVSTYPKEETSVLANQIIALIKDSTLSDYQKLVDIGYLHDKIENEELQPGNKAKEDEFGGKFSYEEDLLHYFVLAYPKEAKIDVNRLKFDIASYNIDNYTKFDFDIETEPLDSKTSLLAVRSLENKDQSLIYFRSIIRKPEVFKALANTDYISFVTSSTNYRAILADKSLSDYLSFFVKNYSRYIKAKPEEDKLLETPEELMAKKAEEDEKLVDQGKFVMVSGSLQSGVFDSFVDTTQCFVVAIKGDGAPVRPVLDKFTDFNKNNFRSWFLQLQLKRAADHQLVVVKGIPGKNEGMSYFRKSVTNRSLFTDLENISYRNFVITEKNLELLTQNGKLDEYLNFFRNIYLQGTTGSEPQNQGAVNDLPGTNQKNTAAEYSGPYKQANDKPHMVVFVLPKEGIDSTGFISGLTRYNETNYFGSKLVVSQQSLDNFRTMVKVTGLNEKSSAVVYFDKLVNDKDIPVPLKGVQYRNILITAENFEIFLKEKNITGYMDFYKKVYLGQ